MSAEDEAGVKNSVSQESKKAQGFQAANSPSFQLCLGEI
jgi:hypothetical protein